MTNFGLSFARRLFASRHICAIDHAQSGEETAGAKRRPGCTPGQWIVRVTQSLGELASLFINGHDGRSVRYPTLVLHDYPNSITKRDVPTLDDEATCMW